MDNRYRITVTDLETGSRADKDGMPGQCDTSLGLICALGGKDDRGSAYYCAVLADHNEGVESRELLHLADAVFHTFSTMGADSGHPRDVFSTVCLAFTKYVKNDIPDAATRELLFNGLALFERVEDRQQ